MAAIRHTPPGESHSSQARIAVRHEAYGLATVLITSPELGVLEVALSGANLREVIRLLEEAATTLAPAYPVAVAA